MTEGIQGVQTSGCEDGLKGATRDTEELVQLACVIEYRLESGAVFAGG